MNLALRTCWGQSQATYPILVEIDHLDEQGKTSKEYMEIKKMAFLEPDLLHAMLKSLADSIGDYANYQVSSCFALRIAASASCAPVAHSKYS